MDGEGCFRAGFWGVIGDFGRKNFKKFLAKVVVIVLESY